MFVQGLTLQARYQ